MGELTNFANHELAIANGIQSIRSSFIQIGLALAAIREGKLYPDGSFDAYCRRRWQFQKSFAGKLIEAAQVAQTVPNDAPKTMALMLALSDVQVNIRPVVLEVAVQARSMLDGNLPNSADLGAAKQAVWDVIQTGTVELDGEQYPNGYSPVVVATAAAIEERLKQNRSQHRIGLPFKTEVMPDQGGVVLIQLPDDLAYALRKGDCVVILSVYEKRDK